MKIRVSPLTFSRLRELNMSLSADEQTAELKSILGEKIVEKIIDFAFLVNETRPNVDVFVDADVDEAIVDSDDAEADTISVFRISESCNTHLS
jgi:hypothetical protein